MEEEKKEPKKDIRLEVQDAFIDVREIFNRSIKEKEVKDDGKVS